jgi:hypothetical protein
MRGGLSGKSMFGGRSSAGTAPRISLRGKLLGRPNLVHIYLKLVTAVVRAAFIAAEPPRAFGESKEWAIHIRS